ncbi:hypothetical protein D3C71_1500760 [compost metagenome]
MQGIAQVIDVLADALAPWCRHPARRRDVQLAPVLHERNWTAVGVADGLNQTKAPWRQHLPRSSLELMLDRARKQVMALDGDLVCRLIQCVSELSHGPAIHVNVLELRAELGNQGCALESHQNGTPMARGRADELPRQVRILMRSHSSSNH